ncbi:hypothetical protein P6U16_00510 [Rhizobium sp. 32-5/1]|nr:hypothetical protein [Rhizobium sp. 32-5/1]WEZ83412.1 hypothetical protein P6U16_00510 [Rhizobium sp. 32-5/1]
MKTDLGTLEPNAVELGQISPPSAASETPASSGSQRSAQQIVLLDRDR